MRFVIINKDGKPLTMEGGSIILFQSREAAQNWMVPGDRIAEARDDVGGTPAIIDD